MTHSSDMVERVSEYISTRCNPLHHSSPSVLREAIEACGVTLVSLKNDEEREEDEREEMRLDERIEEERAELADDLRYIAAHTNDPRDEEIIYAAADALEASHHAQLVEALTLARIYVAAALQEGRVFAQRDLDFVNAVLAKTEGGK